MKLNEIVSAMMIGGLFLSSCSDNSVPKNTLSESKPSSKIESVVPQHMERIFESSEEGEGKKYIQINKILKKFYSENTQKFDKLIQTEEKIDYKGRRIEETLKEDLNGDSIFDVTKYVHTWKYDSKDRLVEEIKKIPDEKNILELSVKNAWKYDSKGNLIQQIKQKGNKKNPLEYTYVQKNFSYDARHNVLEEIYFLEHPGQIRHDKTIFAYDVKNRKIKETEGSIENKKFFKWREFFWKYDSNNNITEQKMVSYDGAGWGEYAQTYTQIMKYDSEGNIIEELHFDVDKKGKVTGKYHWREGKELENFGHPGYRGG